MGVNLSSLEDFLRNIKSVFIERITFTSSKPISADVSAFQVPPIIAPCLRGETVFNTEAKKKSVYLDGGFLSKKEEINGNIFSKKVINPYKSVLYKNVYMFG